MSKIRNIMPVEKSGLAETTATEIFDQIARFAGYGFNKSHAAAYAAISFETAWLKTNHPECFFAAAMNLDLGEVEAIARFAAELSERGIPLAMPSVNASGARFAPVPAARPGAGRKLAIAYGLAAIRGVGEGVAIEIEAERLRGGPFRDFADLTRRLDGKANRKVLESLARAGAFDCLGLNRAQALSHASGAKPSVSRQQMSMFGDLIEDPVDTTPELDRDSLLDGELATLGHFMSGHPLDGMRGRLFDDGLYFAARLLREMDKPPHKARIPAVVMSSDTMQTRSGSVMASVILSDPDTMFEAVVFSEEWATMRSQFKTGARLLLDVTVSNRDGERRISIDSARPVGSQEGAGRTAA